MHPLCTTQRGRVEKQAGGTSPHLHSVRLGLVLFVGPLKLQQCLQFTEFLRLNVS